jgi:hypothetical protein
MAWGSIGEAYEDLGERREAIKFLQRSMEKGTAIEDLRANAALQDLLSDTNFRPPNK